MRERIINVIVILVVLSLGVGVTLYFTKDDSENKITGNRNVTITSEDSINESIKKVYDSVAVVNNYRAGRLTGYGSGFVYKKDDKYGYILTNNHVVEDASEVTVTLSNGEEVQAVNPIYTEADNFNVEEIKKLSYERQTGRLVQLQLKLKNIFSRNIEKEGARNDGTSRD